MVSGPRARKLLVAWVGVPKSPNKTPNLGVEVPRGALVPVGPRFLPGPPPIWAPGCGLSRDHFSPGPQISPISDPGLICAPRRNAAWVSEDSFPGNSGYPPRPALSIPWRSPSGWRQGRATYSEPQSKSGAPAGLSSFPFVKVPGSPATAH